MLLRLVRKWLKAGVMEVMPLERILYVGKAGKAYGFHLDNAYVQDVKSGRAMVVTAVGYANANGVLNDNLYEYDGVTRPLLLAPLDLVTAETSTDARFACDGPLALIDEDDARFAQNLPPAPACCARSNRPRSGA